MENKRHKEIQQDYGDTRLNRASHFVESYVKKKKKHRKYCFVEILKFLIPKTT